MTLFTHRDIRLANEAVNLWRQLDDMLNEAAHRHEDAARVERIQHARRRADDRWRRRVGDPHWMLYPEVHRASTGTEEEAQS